jgi:hypothetical protein
VNFSQVVSEREQNLVTFAFNPEAWNVAVGSAGVSSNMPRVVLCFVTSEKKREIQNSLLIRASSCWRRMMKQAGEQ